MRSVTKVGGRVPMVASGLGKALLATYSEQDVFAIIRRDGMPRLTSKSIVPPASCANRCTISGSKAIRLTMKKP